jgi:hypothetical protein
MSRCMELVAGMGCDMLEIAIIYDLGGRASWPVPETDSFA